MKVALVTQYFPTSGQPWAGHSAYQTVRLLAKLCDLHVFYPEATYPRGLSPASSRPPIDPKWNPPGVEVTYFPYPVLPLVSRPINGFAMAWKLLPAVRLFGPEIVLNYVVYPDGYAAIRLGRTLKIPVVLTAIGSDLNRIPDRFCRALTRSALRHADRVTTVSRDLGKTAVRLGAEPGRVTPILNGCDTSVFHPRDRSGARQSLGLEAAGQIIVYVGRLDVRKGLMELIAASAALRQELPGLRVYLVGDGSDRPVLIQAIAQHGAEDFIMLIPGCPTEQVAVWMAASDLVTLPSYAEGCPNVVIEALSSGRPVVATHVGGIPELMDDRSGRLVPAKDSAALERGLNEVLHQDWDAEAIAARHSRSWGDVAGDLYQVLEQTLQTR